MSYAMKVKTGELFEGCSVRRKFDNVDCISCQEM